MKTLFVFSALILFSFVSFAQKSLNTRVDFLPNEKDSNNVYILLGSSFVFPFNETTSFQTKSLVTDHQKGNRVFQGEMEMLFFPSIKYRNRIEPHVFFRAQAFPMQYLSSAFGFGVSDRKLSSSFGFFVGQYYRHVPYESNFVTRRRKSFEYYPLLGFYLQSSIEDASFLFSLAKEKERTFHSLKVSSRLGRTLSLGKEESLQRSLEIVGVSESFTGNGIGLSVAPLKGLQVCVLLFSPYKSEQEEQARLRNKLSPGLIFYLNYCVN